MIVRFVDIGGIVDNPCLNFLFIIQIKEAGYRGLRACRTNSSIGSSNVTDSFFDLSSLLLDISSEYLIRFYMSIY